MRNLCCGSGDGDGDGISLVVIPEPCTGPLESGVLDADRDSGVLRVVVEETGDSAGDRDANC